MKYLIQRVSEAGYHLRLTKGAVDFLLEKGFDPKFGARPLKRAIQNMLEDKIAEEILNGNIETNKEVKIVANEDKIVIS